MNNAEAAHLSKLAAFGCIACYLDDNAGTPAEMHHPREGKGMAQRADNMDCIPLCPAHHRGTMHPVVPSIHMARYAFRAKYGTESELLALVRELIE
jgi:hypothetical protein